jgi:hypothetical protein
MFFNVFKDVCHLFIVFKVFKMFFMCFLFSISLAPGQGEFWGALQGLLNLHPIGLELNMDPIDWCITNKNNQKSWIGVFKSL